MAKISLDVENSKILEKLFNISREIFKKYSVISNEDLLADDKSKLIEDLMANIREEQELYDTYINDRNLTLLLRHLINDFQNGEDDLINYEALKDEKSILTKRVYNQLIIRLHLQNKLEIDSSIANVKNQTLLYFCKILENKAKDYPEKEELFRQIKFAIYYSNPFIENIVICNRFVADNNCIDFVQNTSADFEKVMTYSKKLIMSAIKNFITDEESSSDKHILKELFLRATTLLLHENAAYDVILEYINDSDDSEYIGQKETLERIYDESIKDRSDDNEYIWQKEILERIYDESIKDRKDLIVKYSQPNYRGIEELDLDLNKLITRAQTILKLYKDLIKSKNDIPYNKIEITNNLEILKFAIEEELKLYIKLKNKGFNYAKKIHERLEEAIEKSPAEESIYDFNKLMANENIYPELRVITLLEELIINEKIELFGKKFVLVSLMYLARLLEIEEVKNPNLGEVCSYKKHMISYLNPIIENLTLCTNFCGYNNYPDKIFPNDTEDRNTKQEKSVIAIRETFNHILNTNPKDKANLKILGLYLRCLFHINGNEEYLSKLEDSARNFYYQLRGLLNYVTIFECFNLIESDKEVLSIIETKEKGLNR